MDRFKRSSDNEMENSLALLVMNAFFLVFLGVSAALFFIIFSADKELSIGGVDKAYLIVGVIISLLLSIICSGIYAVSSVKKDDVYIFYPFFSLFCVLISVLLLCMATGGVFSPFISIFGACFVIPFALKVKNIGKSFILISFVVVILMLWHLIWYLYFFDEVNVLQDSKKHNDSVSRIIFTITVLIVSSSLNFFALARSSIRDAVLNNFTSNR